MKFLNITPHQFLLSSTFWAITTASFAQSTSLSETQRQDELLARQAIVQASTLQKIGRTEESIALLRKTFPSGKVPPSLELAYYKLLGASPTSRNEAIDQLARLLTRKGVNTDQVYKVWQDVLLAMPIDSQDLPDLCRQFLKYKPSQADIQSLLDKSIKQQKQHTQNTQNTQQTQQKQQAVAPKAPPKVIAKAKKATTPKSTIPVVDTTTQFWNAIEQANQALAADRIDEAWQMTDLALKLQPQQPQALALHADLLFSRGDTVKAQAQYNSALQFEPDNSRAIRGLVNLHVLQNNLDEAFNVLVKHAGPRQNSRFKDVWLRVLFAQARFQNDLGEWLKAENWYKQAIEVDPKDAWSRFHLARLFEKTQRRDEAHRLINDGLEAAPDQSDMIKAAAIYWRYAGNPQIAIRLLNAFNEKTPHQPILDLWLEQLELLVELSDDVSYEDLLKRWPTQVAMSSSDLQRKQFIQLRHSIAQAKLNHSASNLQSLYLSMTELKVDDPWLRLDLARLLAKHGEQAQGLQLLETLHQQPNDPQGSHALSLYLSAVGKDEAALAVLEGIQPSLRSPAMVDLQKRLIAQIDDSKRQSTLLEVEALYSKARVLKETGEQDESIKTQFQALKLDPQPKNIAAWNRISRALGADPKSSDQPAFVANQQPPVPANEDVYQDLAKDIDSRKPWFTSGLDAISRAGASGKSQIKGTEATQEFRWPGQGPYSWVARVDSVRLDSGQLDPADTSWGSMALCQSNCAKRSSPAQGNGLNLAFESENNRIDFGTSPQGFLVQNWYGGWRRSETFNSTDVNLEVFRRPVTSTLLSFAGAIDPVSGLTWGGVVGSGVRLSGSWDQGEENGIWSSLRWRKLTGENVQSNQDWQLQSGYQYRPINTSQERLSLGLNGLLWAFARNSGEFSFGHGGYYSPKKFMSVSMPLTYAIKGPRFAMVANASFSRSWSSVGSASFFPTRPDWQQQVESNYEAGSGRGRSHALGLIAEYQFNSHLFVGGRFRAERSADYTPNTATVYLRLSLDKPAAQTVKLIPDAFIPSSRY